MPKGYITWTDTKVCEQPSHPYVLFGLSCSRCMTVSICPFRRVWVRMGFRIPGAQKHFSSSQRIQCSVGLRSGICADYSSSSTLAFANHVFIDLTEFTGALSCWNIFGLSSREEELYRCSIQFGEEPHVGVMVRCPRAACTVHIHLYGSI